MGKRLKSYSINKITNALNEIDDAKQITGSEFKTEFLKKLNNQVMIDYHQRGQQNKLTRAENEKQNFKQTYPIDYTRVYHTNQIKESHIHQNAYLLHQLDELKIKSDLYSNQQLSLTLGLTQNTLSNWYGGNSDPAIQNLVTLSDATDQTIAELIGMQAYSAQTSLSNRLDEHVVIRLLKHQQQKLKLSIPEYAKLIGCATNTLTRIYRKPHWLSLKLYIKIANQLQLPIENLIYKPQ